MTEIVPEALEIGDEIIGSMFLRIPFSHTNNDNIAKDTFHAQQLLPPQPYFESKMAHVHFTAWAGSSLQGGGTSFNYDDNAGHSIPEDDRYLRQIYAKRADFDALLIDHNALLIDHNALRHDHDAILYHLGHVQNRHQEELLRLDASQRRHFFIFVVVCMAIVLYLVMNRSSSISSTSSFSEL